MMDTSSRNNKPSSDNDTATIILPVYNEAEIIESVVNEIHQKILSRLPGSEVLLINDGSTDSTFQILNQKIIPRFSGVKVFNKPNEGHGKSVLYGLELVTQSYIFLMDSDNQTDPQDFWKLWENRDKETVVAGIRKVRYDPASRRILSLFLRNFIWILFGVKCIDSNVPFKLFHLNFYRQFKHLLNDIWLIPSIGISVLAGKSPCYRLFEIPITHRARKTGTSSLQYGKLLKFSAKALLQLIELKNKTAL